MSDNHGETSANQSDTQEDVSKSKGARRLILIAVDGSDHSERAFKFYLENIKEDGDQLKFIHVIEPVYTAPAFGVVMDLPQLPDMAQIMRRSAHDGEVLLKHFMQVAKEHGVKTEGLVLVDSNPGSAVVQMVEKLKANMIILGNRGVGIIRRTFLGSVSDYVLHHSHVPVVIVPPPSS
ncbi:unnamed protein product [Calicophoron daubneyi]|uniref:UspA domain-containing protein n=1 Tax=Calicophoron daubneyi TaxID=300641 RepID=A0AAV2T088_CALDB